MMRRRVGLALVGLALVSAAVAVQAAQDRPWRLECSVDRPWLLVVHDPVGTVRYAWVVTFRVKNPTEQSVFYMPQFTLVTESGKVYRNVVDFAAEQAAEARLGRKLAGVMELIGELKPGETKEGVAVFPLPDPKSDHFQLYVGGLTNEYKVLQRNGRRTVVRKMLLYEYYRPGDAYDLYLDKTYEVGSRWVWR